MHPLLACPVCQRPLQASANSWVCDQGHSFDQSRQGYLNLLLSHKKRSKSPGDTIEMVDARQRLLNTGVYQPISDALNRQVLAVAHSPLHIADIGCGEGYYTQRLYQALPESSHMYGIDISKEAVRCAAKRDQHIHWLVASGVNLPLLPDSLDVITCLFTRLMPESFTKVLKQEGKVFTVTTGKQHLQEMRDILYPEIRTQVFDPDRVMAKHGFISQQKEEVSYQMKLTGPDQIRDLLLMTPHQWRARAENRDNLLRLNQLRVTVDVIVHRFIAEDSVQ